MDARLWVRDGQHDRFVTVDCSPFTLGRRETNTLHLTAAEVSRDHAEIVQDGDRYLLRDLQSRYGTFVNDEPVTEYELRSGDEIRLGRRGGAELAFFRAGDEGSLPGDWVARSIGGVRQLTELLERLRGLGSGRVLQDVLALVIDTALEISRADRGLIMLATPSGDLEFRLARGPGGETLTDVTSTTSRRIPEEVFRTGKTRVERDLFERGIASDHPSTVKLGIRYVVCVALNLVQYVEWPQRRSEDRPIGVLYLDGRARGTLLSTETQSMLETLAAEASVAIENARLYREKAEKVRLEQELRIAAKIQRAMLPDPIARLPHLEAAAFNVPCRAIGGDFFDYLGQKGPVFGFTLGDVAGKGPAAALLGAMVQGMFTFASQTVDANPAMIVASINRALCGRPVEARFVTLLFGVVTPEGRLAYCNAGHNPPFVVSASGVRRLETGGPVIGLLDQARFEQGTMALEPGDLIVVFSDGVTEAQNAGGEEFGDRRVLEAVERARTDGAEAVVAEILDAVRQFTPGVAQSDDITVMAVRYLGAPAPLV